MKRTIILNAHVIVIPGEPPERGRQNIIIEGDHIVAIGSDLDAEDGEIIDAIDRIVIPGLVNAHMHSWQTALRGVASDWDLRQYLGGIHGAYAPHFTPDDTYVATLAAALGQIAAGTTMLGDWFHNNLTPGHTDAAIAALQESGIRALLFNGTLPPRNEAHARSEVERLLAAIEGGNGLLRLGMAVAGPIHSSPEVAEADLRLAQELGLTLSMHHSIAVHDADPVWFRLIDAGLFGPNVNIVHANNISDALLARLVAVGVSFSMTPEVELACGHGFPITGRLRALGAAPSLGVDIESSISGEVLLAARMALAHQRGADHAAVRAGGAPGIALRSADALRWATLEGARALGVLDCTGTLEAGKQADLVLIDTRVPGLWSSHDPVATALNASVANIEAVMIAGVWRKRDGALLHADTEALRQRLVISGRRLAEASGAAPA